MGNYWSSFEFKVLPFVFCFLFCASADDQLIKVKTNGCSTKCSVTFDKNIDCFNSTLQFFQRSLYSVMNSYLVAQIKIANLTGKSIDSEDAVTHAYNSMKKVKIYNEGDMDEMYSAGDAKDIVRLLIANANNPQADLAVTCPQGCEKSMSPWLPIFIASAALNIVFFLLAAGAMLLATKREEKQAAKIFQEALITSHGIKKD